MRKEIVMRNLRRLYTVALVFLIAGPAEATVLPDELHCDVSGHAGCSDICVGAGIKEPSIKLGVSRKSRQLSLNGVRGWFVNDQADPYAAGAQQIQWRLGVIALNTYRLDQPQPGRVFITLTGGENLVEFHCLGSLNAE